MPADGVARRVDVPLRVEITDDATAAKASERHEVTVRVTEVEAADQLEVAARAAERGDFAAAGAALQLATDDLKKKQAARPSAKIANQIAEFEEAQREVAEAKTSARARKAYTKKFKAKAYKAKKR